jgi:hypothetical protein
MGLAEDRMTRHGRLSWIAEAEARRFEEAASIQRGPAEPAIGVVLTGSAASWRRWVRRLVARLAAGPELGRPEATDQDDKRSP